jgi:hypothetical protein
MPSAARRSGGWWGVTALALVYAVLMAANYWLPLDNSNYTSRLWNWSQAALSLGAVVTVVALKRLPGVRVMGVGLVLGTVSAAAHALHDPGLAWSLQEGFAVWVCFVAGALLFEQPGARTVRAFEQPPVRLGRSVLLGCLIAVPLAIINNLYFYLNAGTVEFENLFRSALAALSPAIHEEVIFRYFVLAVVFHLLGPGAARGPALVAALGLAVVPHSLNHLPDLFLENPAMGLAMLVATSLLFGLPMALLQVRRNLETAMAFHWFIDFARFWFGY